LKWQHCDYYQCHALSSHSQSRVLF
jgi:hypothetical protein